MNRTSAILLFGLLSGASLETLAGDSCSEIDLRRPGGSMEKMKVLDQGPLPVCFSYAAAQMADAWRLSHGGKPPEQGISPVWLAVHAEYADDDEAYTFTGGDACSALDAVRKKGLCHLPKGVTSERAKSAMNVMSLYRGYLERLKEMSDVEGKTKTVMARNNGVTIAMLEKELGCTFTRKPPFEDFLSELMPKIDPLRTLARELASECGGHLLAARQMPGCTDKIAHGKSGERMINELLARKNAQPVGVDFCAKVLYRERPFRGEWTGLMKGECGKHTVLVIGRKRVGNTCRYLVRNSWGTGCGKYWMAGWDCEAGDIWIDAEDLTQNMSRVNTLDRPPERFEWSDIL